MLVGSKQQAAGNRKPTGAASLRCSAPKDTNFSADLIAQKLFKRLKSGAKSFLPELGQHPAASNRGEIHDTAPNPRVSPYLFYRSQNPFFHLMPLAGPGCWEGSLAVQADGGSLCEAHRAQGGAGRVCLAEVSPPHRGKGRRGRGKFALGSGPAPKLPRRHRLALECQRPREKHQQIQKKKKEGKKKNKGAWGKERKCTIFWMRKHQSQAPPTFSKRPKGLTPVTQRKNNAPCLPSEEAGCDTQQRPLIPL